MVRIPARLGPVSMISAGECIVNRIDEGEWDQGGIDRAERSDPRRRQRRFSVLYRDSSLRVISARRRRTADSLQKDAEHGGGPRSLLLDVSETGRMIRRPRGNGKGSGPVAVRIVETACRSTSNRNAFPLYVVGRSPTNGPTVVRVL